MTTPRRFESDLPALLVDLYMAGTPDYRDELVQRIERTPQRPAWTFPERWLPVELVTARVPSTRVPWRQLGVLALIALLLAAVLAVYIGSHTPRLPSPFGPAGNGLIAYSKDGDIYTVDPKTGVTTAIVTGPEIDQDPEFSRDGARLIFARTSSAPGEYDLVVSNADGSDQRIVKMDRRPGPDDTWQLMPDGRSVLVAVAGVLTLYGLVGDEAPKVIGRGRFVAGEIRPPDGTQIVFENDETPDIDLWIMDSDGANARMIYRPPKQAQGDLAAVRWSPDGKLIAFECAQDDDSDGSRICVMDADGQNIRVLDHAPGVWYETDLVWSPDSKSVAFNRWFHDPEQGTFIKLIGLASVARETVADIGPTPESAGALFDYSPDGTVLMTLPARMLGSAVGAAPAKPVAIDVATGKANELTFEITSNVSWQRVAP